MRSTKIEIGDSVAILDNPESFQRDNSERDQSSLFVQNNDEQNMKNSKFDNEGLENKDPESFQSNNSKSNQPGESVQHGELSNTIKNDTLEITVPAYIKTLVPSLRVPYYPSLRDNFSKDPPFVYYSDEGHLVLFMKLNRDLNEHEQNIEGLNPIIIGPPRYTEDLNPIMTGPQIRYNKTTSNEESFNTNTMSDQLKIEMLMANIHALNKTIIVLQNNYVYSPPVVGIKADVENFIDKLKATDYNEENAPDDAANSSSNQIRNLKKDFLVALYEYYAYAGIEPYIFIEHLDQLNKLLTKASD